ncbi:MAG: carbohydrate ABC transporter permease [Candidatus Nanopelagicales bacterium]|jgi:multiple sugar transport system permease protein|nr:carbohydrate ABC transporter permease [Candidatus Nanopelagicales bacterium]
MSRSGKPVRGVRGHAARAFVYLTLAVAGMVVLIPFIFALSGSFKTAEDVFTYPPRLLPHVPATATVDGEDLPVFTVPLPDGSTADLARVENGTSLREFRSLEDPDLVLVAPRDQLTATGTTVVVDGEEKDVYIATIDGAQVEVYDNRSRIGGTYIDPADPAAPPVFAVPADVVAVEEVEFQRGNYSTVFNLNGFNRALTNTVLVTILVVVGQVVTSILGGYAFARLRFKGREKLFLLYLGSIMIPFVVLIIPLYRLMVSIGWVNDLVSLVIPFVFTAYGTFLMRQFFVTIPKELEEAAVLDGASRWTILWRVFVPLSVPAIATLTTFAFLYAWNSFVWPLIVIDSGNQENSVLALTLATLGGRAADAPNLVLAGVMIAMIPPVTVFLLAQRYFVENVASSGIKG